MDREKVIKGFELFIKEFELFIKEIHPVCTGEGVELDMFRNVLAMLKEQEPVKPIPYHRSDGTIFKYECRKCRTKIFKNDQFCRRCGRSVKWE